MRHAKGTATVTEWGLTTGPGQWIKDPCGKEYLFPTPEAALEFAARPLFREVSNITAGHIGAAIFRTRVYHLDLEMSEPAATVGVPRGPSLAPTYLREAVKISAKIKATQGDIDFLDGFNSGEGSPAEGPTGVILRNKAAIRAALLARRKELELELARL